MIEFLVKTIVPMLESTAIHVFVVGNAWVWPLMETLHFLGLILLLGALLIIDLALIGVFKKLSSDATHRLLKLVLIGFVLNLVTGVLFVFGDPGRYFINIAFQIKVALLVCAALNALWYGRKIAPKLVNVSEFLATGETKIVGALSLILWFAVLIFGRLIPYMGTG